MHKKPNSEWNIQSDSAHKIVCTTVPGIVHGCLCTQGTELHGLHEFMAQFNFRIHSSGIQIEGVSFMLCLVE